MTAPEYESLARTLTSVLGARARSQSPGSDSGNLSSLIRVLQKGLESHPDARKAYNIVIKSPGVEADLLRFQSSLERALKTDKELAQSLSKAAERALAEVGDAGTLPPPSSGEAWPDPLTLQADLEGDPTTDPTLPGDSSTDSSEDDPEGRKRR